MPNGQTQCIVVYIRCSSERWCALVLHRNVREISTGFWNCRFGHPDKMGYVLYGALGSEGIPTQPLSVFQISRPCLLLI